MAGDRRFETVDCQRRGGVATVWLDRPDSLNGITNTMSRELYELVGELAGDDSVAVVVLTGRGRAFCPGADLKHYSSGAADETLRAEYFHVVTLLHEMPALTIAAINGACAGAGLGYALACDLRYAAEGAMFNTAFLGVAVAGDMGIPWTLPRIVGAGVARELSFFPRKVRADEAAELRLVNGVFADDELLGEVGRRADEFAARAPLARRALKEHYVAAEAMGFEEFITMETRDHLRITESADTTEAFRAFVEKRPARFEGR
ncbi:MAG: enoyl-CoA hydratase/isomerase family protein [Ilumatobacter sp.]|nr:enoyl-CoA hydratase/isomerase family protein [Ilumatobacter sp.]